MLNQVGGPVTHKITALSFGYLANIFGAVSNPSMYGPLLTMFTTIGYGLAGHFYWRAGDHYTKHMHQRDS